MRKEKLLDGSEKWKICELKEMKNDMFTNALSLSVISWIECILCIERLNWNRAIEMLLIDRMERKKDENERLRWTRMRNECEIQT